MYLFAFISTLNNQIMSKYSKIGFWISIVKQFVAVKEYVISENFLCGELILVRTIRKYVISEYVITEISTISYIGGIIRQMIQIRTNRVYVISRVRCNRVPLYLCFRCARCIS